MMLACTWQPSQVAGANIPWRDWLEMEVQDRDFLLEEIQDWRREEAAAYRRAAKRSR